MLVDYPFESKFLTIDNQQMHYVDEGEGPVIVMVHGNPTWSYYFRNLIRLLSKHHRVIAFDHIGCGLSDKPQKYNYKLAQHRANMQQLLKELKIKTYSLIVHDWGGAIGMGCAVASPENIEKIVVLNSAAFRSKRIPLRIRICKLPVVGEFIVRAFNGFAWPATFMAVVKPLSKEVSRSYTAPYDSWKNRVAVSRFVQDIPLNERHPSYQELTDIEQGLEKLKDKKIPMLIIWGGKDFCFTQHFFKEWCQRFPSAENHYFSDGGHYVLEDKKKEIHQLLTKFFGVTAAQG